MRVSVIIPVYNAERFLEKAVVSALQPETGEVLLVDDGSSDRSLEICNELAKKDARVKVHRHDDLGNHGTAATRNLGVTRAQCELVAFLDNDDFYLPGRFSKAVELLTKHKDIDGIYEAIGTYAYDDESLEKHMERMRAARPGETDLSLTTITQPVPPDELFDAVLFDKYGWFHINGLTLRRTVFDKVGLLDPELIWDEDTEFFYRLTYLGKLIAGKLNEPVAMRGVYKGNRTLSPEGQAKADYYHTFTWKKMFYFMLKHRMSTAASRHILRRHLEYYDPEFIKVKSGLQRKLMKLARLTRIMIMHPALLSRLGGRS